MKMNLKWVKALSLLASLALVSTGCLIGGGAQPAPTDSGQQALQTAAFATLTAITNINIPLQPTAAATKSATVAPPTDTLAPTPTALTDTVAAYPVAPTDTISFTPTPPGTPVPINLLPANLTIEGLGCVPTQTRQDLAIVLKVIDGSTIQVILNGQVVIVSYIGVVTPVMPSGSNPGGRLANQAYQLNKTLVSGKIVILVKDTTEADANGHLLRYVLTDKLFINNEMIKQGYAAALATPPDVACRMTFEATQQKAMAALIGLWQPTPTSTARPNNLPSLTPTFQKSAH